MFHLEISGKDFKEEQPSKAAFISLIFSKFHLDIFGKEDKELQL